VSKLLHQNDIKHKHTFIFYGNSVQLKLQGKLKLYLLVKTNVLQDNRLLRQCCADSCRIFQK